MFCRNCGLKIPDDSKFCSQCGTAVGEAEAAPAPRENSPAPRKHTVTIFRESQLYLVNPPVNISINNQKCSAVDNGGTVVFELEEGRYIFEFSLHVRKQTVDLTLTRDTLITLKWDRITGALKAEVR